MDNDQGERVIQRVRHPLVIRRAKVARVSSLSPHMRRIVVSGAELNGFFSPGFDDHVKLFMPAPGAALVLPSVGERGMEFPTDGARPVARRSEEHTSELQSLMRISYAVFCLKKK